MHAAVFIHMGLNCIDPLRMEKFYEKYFGFKRKNLFIKDSGEQIIMIGSENTYLELFKVSEKSFEEKTGATGLETAGWRHICFSVDNLDEMLLKFGDDLKITLGPLKLDSFVKGMRACWIEDPEGNIIELNEGYSEDSAI